MKRYTAQDMLELADRMFDYKNDSSGLELVDCDKNCVDADATYDVICMLRQAADDMEREEKRERKYEYAWSYSLDGIKNNIGLPKEWIERIVKWDPECKMFRRVVSEWEVIGDGQN